MKKIYAFLLVGCTWSCTTYYQKYSQFYSSFEQGKFEAAQKALLKEKRANSHNNRLLYNLNLGTATFMEGKYKQSNQFFEEAYKIGEDLRKNPLQQAMGFLINPNLTAYRGEDFELILLHYYKALAFLKQNELEKALVECRRVNLKLLALSDKYTSDKKYKEDAFFHMLMGIIYDASKDYNNAFIAYRNAVDIFEKSYTDMFGVQIPLQLKKDVIRTAHLAYLSDEQLYFEEKFQLNYEPLPENTGELVFFWHSGMGPIKSEFSLDFTTVRRGEQLLFVNEKTSENFSFHVNDDDYKAQGLISVNALKIVLPTYVQRPLFYNQASLVCGQVEQPLELGQNVHALALKSLQQRLHWELTKSLLKAAIRKAAEAKIREKDKATSEIFGFFAQQLQQADTRAWQVVPHSIFYARLNLPAGNQQIFLKLSGNGANDQKVFNFDIQKNKTLFHFFHSMQIGNF